MDITRSWFADQMRRVATLAADPSAASHENIEARLHVLETSIASILQRLEDKEPE